MLDGAFNPGLRGSYPFLGFLFAQHHFKRGKHMMVSSTFVFGDVKGKKIIAKWSVRVNSLPLKNDVSDKFVSYFPVLGKVTNFDQGPQFLKR